MPNSIFELKEYHFSIFDHTWTPIVTTKDLTRISKSFLLKGTGSGNRLVTLFSKFCSLVWYTYCGNFTLMQMQRQRKVSWWYLPTRLNQHGKTREDINSRLFDYQLTFAYRSGLVLWLKRQN